MTVKFWDMVVMSGFTYLRAGVIEHHVHHDFHTSFMNLRAQVFPIFHSSEHGVDGLVVRDIVALVFERRLINRRQPYHIDTESFEVIQPLDYAAKVTDSVIVAILKRLHIDFVDDNLPPPNTVQIQDHGFI